MSAPDRPPLWTWAAATVLAGAVVAGLVAAHDALQPQVMAYQLNLARFDQPAGPARRRIVVLGTSKSQCAIEFDDAMEVRLRRLGVDADFVRVTYTQARYEDLRYAFDRMEKDPPALVLVGADLLLLQPRAYSTPEDLREPWTSRLRGDLASIAGRRARQDDAAGGAVSCDVLAAGFPPRKLAVYARLIGRARASTPQERVLYTDRLDRLRAHGTITGLLTLPQTPAAQAAFRPALLADMAAARDDLIQRHGLIELTPPFPPPASAFIDQGHLNAMGRELYSDWLAREIARRLAAKAPGA